MEDVGKPKALVIRDKLVEKHPSLSVKSLERRVEEIPKSILLNSDIILSCLDNLPSRVYLASVAVKYSIPMVDAGIVGYQGRIQSYIPPNGPCPTCIIPEAQYPQLAELRNPCTPDMNDEAIPSLPTSNKLVSSVQSHEALKIILSTKKVPNEVIGEPLKDPLIIDLKYNRYTVMPIKKNNKCIVCGKDGIAKEKSLRLELSHETTASPTKILNKIKEVEDIDKNDYAILIEDGAAFKKVRKDKWNEDVKMARGKYIYVIFKNKGSDEYKEAAIKLLN